MPILSITVSAKTVKCLAAICNYYGTTATKLLEGYIDAIIKGARPIGFEFYDNKEPWEISVKNFNEKILSQLDRQFPE